MLTQEKIQSHSLPCAFSDWPQRQKPVALGKLEVFSASELLLTKSENGHCEKTDNTVISFSCRGVQRKEISRIEIQVPKQVREYWENAKFPTVPCKLSVTQKATRHRVAVVQLFFTLNWQCISKV